MNGLNKPSFFRKGGLLTAASQHTTIGRNPDGSIYIDIAGQNSARAILTPQQAFEAANGILHVLGYRLELGNGPQ